MSALRKILFLNYEYPPLGGGGGNATEQIAREMVQQGLSVSVMTSLFGNLKAEETTVDGVLLYRIPTLRRHIEKCSVFEMMVFLLSSLFFVVRYYRRIKPDFVICFFSLPCGPAALLLKLLFRVPYVVALRGGDVPGFLPEQLAGWHFISNWLTRLIWRHATVLTTNSQGLADLALKFYDKTQVRVIPNGVDESFFLGGESSDACPVVYTGDDQNSSLKKLNILTAGRLSRQKKVDRLIACIARLKEKGHEAFCLSIAGDGPERDALEKLAAERHVLNTQVFFLGWRNKENLKQDYQRADVFALASDYEGMPNVVLEAMASSLAVVATRAPGTVDLVTEGKNGYLISLEALTQLDDCLVTLLENRTLLKEMQQDSCQRAREYTWEKVACAYAALYTLFQK